MSKRKDKIDYIYLVRGVLILGVVLIIGISCYKMGDSDGYIQARFDMVKYLRCVDENIYSAQLCADTYLRK